eukprot:scaffold37733_cov63-Phaeocystis_antarctica.AAC.1
MVCSPSLALKVYRVAPATRDPVSSCGVWRWGGYTELKLKIVRRSTPLLRYPPNVSGTPTLGLYQPRALCAVASHLLPGLRCGEDFCRGCRLPHGPVYPLHTRCQCVWPSPVACVAAR